MKLYEVNQAIADIFEQMLDPDTGEVIVSDDALMEQLTALQMERSRILQYLAQLVLNTRAEAAMLKEEEKRLKAHRSLLEKKDERIMAILDRECAGEKTDCGVATVSYRKTERVEVADAMKAFRWLKRNKHPDCYRIADPEISKTEVKKLLKAGTDVPGVNLLQDVSCSLK